jgi:hypothetical protein
MPDDDDLPVEVVLAAIRREKPSFRIERFQATHPADDDNLWFFSEGSAPDAAKGHVIEVQIETHPGGQPPFLIESTGHDQRVTTADVEEAVAIILAWLPDR